MKKSAAYLIILLLTLTAYHKNATAGSASGGELIYEWLSDSTYRFFFKYYNSCAGDTADTVQVLCLYNSCLDTGFTLTMDRWNGTLPGGQQDGDPYMGGCTKVKTNCDSPGSAMPGIKQYWYTVITKLPAKCSLWRFSVTVQSRSNNINLDPATGKNNLYLETTFNNLFFQGNSSPYFTILPIPYVCNNIQYSYNNGAIDPQGDSIVTDIVRPMTKSADCSDTAEFVPFATGTPSLSLPSNPFQTNNSLSVIPQFGTINFTPAIAGPNNLVTRVREYRNGVLVGTIIRDLQIQVLTCTLENPSLNKDANSVTGGYYSDSTFYGCPQQTLSFCWDVVAQNTGTILVTDDNHTLIPSLYSATVTYSRNKSDSVRGCFSWTPATKDTGRFGFIVTIKDSTCRPPGIMLYYTRALLIYIWSPVSIIKDTTICLGQSVQLQAKGGGGNYNWSVLSGTGGSINCTNCDTPIAKPSGKTMYRAVAAASSFCSTNTDTVTVNVKPNVPSSIFIIADTTITEGDLAIVSSIGVNCPHPVFEWLINGIALPSYDSSKLVFEGFKDLDTVTCRLVCTDTCAQPAETISNSIVFHVTPKPVGINGISKETFSIYPNPNNGSFILAGPAHNSLQISVVNYMGQTVYTETIGPSATALQKPVNTNILAPGVYTLRLATQNNIQTLRFNISR